MLEERQSAPGDSVPSAAELDAELGENVLVLLPEQVTESNGEVFASFREDAQALRVHGAEAGLDVRLHAPPGARLGVYREHAAEWVLPLLAFAGGTTYNIVCNLVANEIQRYLDRWRDSGSGREPVVRYREAVIEKDRVRVREIDGPASEMIAWLKEGAPELERGGEERPDNP
jgi:hypothetical protein